MQILVGFLAIIIVAIAYLAITYYGMIDYAYNKHPTTVFKPGAQFLLTQPKNGDTTTPAYRYVVLGDSTSLGQGADNQTESYSYLYAQSTLLRRHHSVQLYNLAISGAKTADVLTRQVAYATSLDPNLIMLSVGANDVTGLVSPVQFRQNYALILQKLTGTNAKVVLLNIPSLSPAPLLRQPYRFLADYRVRQLNQVIAEITQNDPSVKVVDIYNGTKREFRLYPKRNFARDKYHPSSDGYAVWAKVIAKAVP